MEPTGEAAATAPPEPAPPRRTSYEAYAYRSDPRHRQYEVDSVACKRQWHTERACTPSPLRLNDAAPAVDVTVVLARYEEDVSWILSYPKVRFAIYNKGPELPAEVLAHGRLEVVAKPNRGREGASYIDYVRDHYDALPAVVVFSQAAPTDKVPDFYAFLDEVLDGRSYEPVWHGAGHDAGAGRAAGQAHEAGLFVEIGRRVHQVVRDSYPQHHENNGMLRSELNQHGDGNNACGHR